VRAPAYHGSLIHACLNTSVRHSENCVGKNRGLEKCTMSSAVVRVHGTETW
jgi:hypothetical protein